MKLHQRARIACPAVAMLLAACSTQQLQRTAVDWQAYAHPLPPCAQRLALPVAEATAQVESAAGRAGMAVLFVNHELGVATLAKTDARFANTSFAVAVDVAAVDAGAADVRCRGTILANAAFGAMHWASVMPSDGVVEGQLLAALRGTPDSATAPQSQTAVQDPSAAFPGRWRIRIEGEHDAAAFEADGLKRQRNGSWQVTGKYRRPAGSYLPVVGTLTAAGEHFQLDFPAPSPYGNVSVRSSDLNRWTGVVTRGTAEPREVTLDKVSAAP